MVCTNQLVVRSGILTHTELGNWTFQLTGGGERQENHMIAQILYTKPCDERSTTSSHEFQPQNTQVNKVENCMSNLFVSLCLSESVHIAPGEGVYCWPQERQMLLVCTGEQEQTGQCVYKWVWGRRKVGGWRGRGREGHDGRLFTSSSMTCLFLNCAKFGGWLAFLTRPAAADEMTAEQRNRIVSHCVITAKINKLFCNCLDIIVMHTQVGGGLLILALHTINAVQSLYFNIHLS